LEPPECREDDYDDAEILQSSRACDEEEQELDDFDKEQDIGENRLKLSISLPQWTAINPNLGAVPSVESDHIVHHV
jgi:hypothetical protein